MADSNLTSDTHELASALELEPEIGQLIRFNIAQTHPNPAHVGTETTDETVLIREITGHLLGTAESQDDAVINVTTLFLVDMPRVDIFWDDAIVQIGGRAVSHQQNWPSAEISVTYQVI